MEALTHVRLMPALYLGSVFIASNLTFTSCARLTANLLQGAFNTPFLMTHIDPSRTFRVTPWDVWQISDLRLNRIDPDLAKECPDAYCDRQSTYDLKNPPPETVQVATYRAA
ncbi:hypothetical protein PSCICO_52280 [Pseudomonas cichorii]|nr:hypothetical protein PSCICO_52280 [Pseudomonas cichorii]